MIKYTINHFVKKIYRRICDLRKGVSKDWKLEIRLVNMKIAIKYNEQVIFIAI